jgi:hypothetical protein
MAVGLLSNVAVAADKPAKGDKWPEPTKEQRQKMAEMHEKMAACLKSDKPASDCHKEMMASCKEAMGKECPMMHGKGHGMHHGHDEEHEKGE